MYVNQTDYLGLLLERLEALDEAHKSDIINIENLNTKMRNLKKHALEELSKLQKEYGNASITAVMGLYSNETNIYDKLILQNYLAKTLDESKLNSIMLRVSTILQNLQNIRMYFTSRSIMNEVKSMQMSEMLA